MKANIFNIQRFCISDGPGIRTVVFFKGCPLRCLWCHNPEGLSKETQLEYFRHKCVGCGECVYVCPVRAHSINQKGEHVFNRSICTMCGKCANVCLQEALRIVGSTVDVEHIFSTVMKDIDYYKESEGGLTVSGGEPLMQADAVAELFALCKKAGIHTAVDTSAYVAYSCFEKVLPYTDLFMIDLKIMDSELSNRYIRRDNSRILSNFNRIAKEDIDLIVRLPIIKGINDTVENAERSLEYILKAKRLKYVELLPYHDIGRYKYTALGMEDVQQGMCAPDLKTLDELREIFEKAGIRVYNAYE